MVICVVKMVLVYVELYLGRFKFCIPSIGIQCITTMWYMYMYCRWRSQVITGGLMITMWYMYYR